MQNALFMFKETLITLNTVDP